MFATHTNEQDIDALFVVVQGVDYPPHEMDLHIENLLKRFEGFLASMSEEDFSLLKQNI